MRPVMLIGLIAVIFVPMAASAKPGRDRSEWREQNREVRGSQRRLREDRDEGRQGGGGWGRNDWREGRRSHRGLYSRGHWRAPFAYRTFRPGLRIDEQLYRSRYHVVDPWRYRLPAARPGLRWVRHYDDVLLVDPRRGIVVDVIRNFFW